MLKSKFAILDINLEIKKICPKKGYNSKSSITNWTKIAWAISSHMRRYVSSANICNKYEWIEIRLENIYDPMAVWVFGARINIFWEQGHFKY